jgi:hypothetical protein
MKRIIFLTLCFAAFISFASAQQTNDNIAKRIADAMPPALPQAPKADGTRSDLYKENLKGKVKTVTVYNIDHERKQSDKNIISEETYNDDGDRIRGVYYFDGNIPRSVATYGYVDRMRVARWGSVKNGNGSDTDSPIVQVPVGMNRGTKKSDSRYDTKYVYRYDEKGRLAEEIHFSSSGELQTRTVITYESPMRRLLRHFAGGPEEIARTVEILDTEGNVVELWMYDEDKKVNEVQVIKHELDSQGNWIVENVFIKEIDGDRTNLKPLATNFRTITYY